MREIVITLIFLLLFSCDNDTPLSPTVEEDTIYQEVVVVDTIYQEIIVDTTVLEEEIDSVISFILVDAGDYEIRKDGFLHKAYTKETETPDTFDLKCSKGAQVQFKNGGLYMKAVGIDTKIEGVYYVWNDRKWYTTPK
jgi:hypothetical protein